MVLICVLADQMAVDECTCDVCILQFDLFVCAISRRLCADSIAVFSFVHVHFKDTEHNDIVDIGLGAMLNSESSYRQVVFPSRKTAPSSQVVATKT